MQIIGIFRNGVIVKRDIDSMFSSDGCFMRYDDYAALVQSVFDNFSRDGEIVHYFSTDSVFSAQNERGMNHEKAV